MLLCVIVVLAFVPALVAQSGPTEDSLKLAHQTLMSAITSGNPAMLEGFLHQSGLGFFKDSQMIVQFGGGSSAKEGIPAVLADLGRFTMSNLDAVYRVAGDTGVVCMATTMQPKKGEKGPPRYLRSTWVYANLGGTWKLVSWHTSDIPLAKPK